MSFSRKVKEELQNHVPKARHCQLAETAAILSICGEAEAGKRGLILRVKTENLTVAEKYSILIKEAFQYQTGVKVSCAGKKKNRGYQITVDNPGIAEKILEATKFLKEEEERIGPAEIFSSVSSRILEQTCCKRAFLRGTFLAAGSINSPEKTYHFELVFLLEEKARQVQEVILSFGLKARLVVRKKYYVVYMKGGSSIVDILNIMEAHVALMDLENIRIVKEMRNSINRQVNCEAANISKTVVAATKQIDDIRYIRDTVGFYDLNENLREIAELRIAQPEASLKELGEMLCVPIGKSGVNHRLRKLSEIADNLREKQYR